MYIFVWSAGLWLILTNIFQQKKTLLVSVAVWISLNMNCWQTLKTYFLKNIFSWNGLYILIIDLP